MGNTAATTIKKQPKTIIRKVKRSNVKASAMLLLIMIIFCMFSIILVYQRNVINNLDSQISTLENAYNKAVMLNDDLEGQLMQAKKLTDVENYAVKKLGMVKPDNSDITYVAYNNSDVKTNADEIQGEGTFLSWVSNLFN